MDLGSGILKLPSKRRPVGCSFPPRSLDGAKRDRKRLSSSIYASAERNEQSQTEHRTPAVYLGRRRGPAQVPGGRRLLRSHGLLLNEIADSRARALGAYARNRRVAADCHSCKEGEDGTVERRLAEDGGSIIPPRCHRPRSRLRSGVRSGIRQRREGYCHWLAWRRLPRPYCRLSRVGLQLLEARYRGAAGHYQ